MHVIKNNLKEKFQRLQDCFDTLNSNFIDAATNILTSKALVTETKQHFQSYIKEDVNCESAHQLVQLLQPHYSCLNINLFTTPCTITEPIKEQIENYNTNLKMFKDTTSLLELAMMTKGMQYPDGVSCSKLILRLNKSWCSRTIAELNKMENFYLLSTLSFLNLIETHYDASSCTCTYFLPQLSQTESLMAAILEQRVSLYKIGVFEIMIGDIPIMMEDESALQEVYRTNNENVLILLKLNITLSIENDTTDLMIASRRGDFLTVQCLLSKDPDINIKNNNGVTALMFASANGHHQVVELLLSEDPDINIQDDDGTTALMIASCCGHHQVVELLLSKDPDIIIQNNDGVTAFMIASSNGHHQVVELLLSKDPDIKIKDNNGWTALMHASRYGHHHVVELLLSKDPDINIQNNDGWTALMHASRYGHDQVVEILLSQDPDINIQNNDRVTALMHASGNGHHQVVELLLSKDPDINIQSNDGVTALMYASVNGHHQVVELLLSKDPDINIQNNDGVTALMYASVNGHHQVVELLLSKDPDINIQNNDGWTALMHASRCGHYQVVELLLSKDPDINIQNNGGMSAFSILLNLSKLFVSNVDISLDDHAQLLDQLHSGNYIKILELLLNSHSNEPNHIHTFDGKKFHSLELAALCNNFDAIEILIRKCDITPEHIISGFTRACYGGHSSIMIRLSEEITTFLTNERKLLVAAAEGDLGTLISMIYEVGMSPDTPLVAGITPLMTAASCGHIELVDTLIKAGADVNKRNNEGMNALDIVSHIPFYNRWDVKELLITNTRAVEPDPVLNNDETTNSTDLLLNNDETTNKKPSTGTAIKSILGMFNSFMKKEYNSYYIKQKELKMPYGVTDTNTPNLAMKNNMSQFVS